MHWIIFIILGFIVGVVVGLTGIGGGVLMAPSLIFLGVEPIIAIGTDLLYAAITKGLGAYFHNKKGNVNTDIALKLFFGSFPAIAIGSIILRTINRDEINTFLTIMLSIVLIFTSIINLKKEFFCIHKKYNSSKILVFFGFLVGLVVQFTSIGSGVLITFALMNFTNLSPRDVIGTSLFYGLLLTFFSSVSYISLGSVNYNLVLLLIFGTIPGVYLGAYLNSKIKPKNLRKMISLMILVVGVVLLIKKIKAIMVML
ncbi:sulfite exporter TauE/SafE family protein [Methanocaldococcus indicus]|uniref:sulfite exporter TauE/SafE family protein n=1 Tax=Methanocaldococcus indicus TaxID=213231 RepID=UPI003C6D38B3